jgi:manganese/zinc/iron transport system permease protein
MYHNPYFDQDFFEFFWVLLGRLLGFFTGQLGVNDLVADEIQMLVLSSVAASSALIGTFLVLRNMTMLANAISHTILLGIVLAFLMTTWGTEADHVRQLGHLNLNALLFAAAITGLATAFLTQLLTSRLGIQNDASIGLVFHTLFALGIVLVTLFTRNAHVGPESIMGNADALHVKDIKLAFIILALNVVIIVLFFKEFKLTTFDPQLAQALGISTITFNYLLMLQVSITSIGAFRAVGVVMVLAFITGPPLTARLLTNKLGLCLWMSIGIGILASLSGVALSRHILTIFGSPLSTAGLIVCLIACFFALALIFAPQSGIVAHWRQRKHLAKRPL